MPCKVKFPIIPTAYDADLSNEEKIIILMAQVQEAADTLARHSEASYEWITFYVSTQLSVILNRLDGLGVSVSGRFDESETAIADMVALVSAYMDRVFLDAYERANHRTDEMASRVNKRLDSIHLDDVPLRNLVTGELDPVQFIINDLAGLHQSAPTAEAFDAAELTASVFDDLSLSAFAYDFTGI